MNVKTLDATTFEVRCTRPIRNGTPFAMALRFDRLNTAWVIRCLEAFLDATSGPPDCANGPDQLTSRTGGTDQEPCLTILNFRTDAGGSIVLTEAESAELLATLRTDLGGGTDP